MERLDAFMARANAAYYANRDPFADFTTSPEITQVFGEVLGLWAAVTWEAMGRPDPVLLVECGPGRGTLMADALRAITQAAPGFRAALRIHLVETSPRLRAAQAAALPEGVAWHDDLASVPPGPMLLLANEFLDALPIRQFVRRRSRWMERFVEDGSFVETPVEDGTFLLPLPPGESWGVGVLAAEREATGAPSTPSLFIHARTDPPSHPDPLPEEEEEGATLELCQPAQNIAAGVATRVAQDGGAALFLDYGPEHSAAGDSLQALRNGKPADPLAAPGEADLTAHVDFTALARAASRARTHGPVPQGLFLARLGLFQRSGRLARTQPPAKAASLMQAAQRLAEPNRMGHLFKALCIAHPDLPTPAGFEP